MYLSASLFLLVLPSLIVAQAQKPLGEKIGDNLQEWFNKAKSFIPASATSPVDTTSAKVASVHVTSLTKDNWKTELSSSSSSVSNEGPVTWMILFSGGNKTCYGQCAGIEQAWNASAVALAADPTAPKLGYVNCDTNAILCSIWAAGPPSIWHVQLPVPAADQSPSPTTIHIMRLNTTTTTAQDIIEIHYAKTYENTPVYESVLHPFDGSLAKFGLNVPLGYVLFGFAMIPSWAFMIVVSFVSRTIM